MSRWFGWPDWMLEGACRDIDRTDLDRWFFAPSNDTAAAEKAKAVCQFCPVKDKCLEYALERPDVGIWGGTTQAERREMK